MIGATGAGKTNFLLYVMHHIHSHMNAAVIFVDPHGQASIDLARMIPETRVFDPYYSPFGLNPLELGPYSSQEERKIMIQMRVGELLAVMADFFSVTVDRAPRLLWILRGALLYLYSITDTPTFLDLYYLLTDIMGMEEGEAAYILGSAGLDDETVVRTLEVMSRLEAAAFTAVLNRISNFVMPSGSLTARTFCSRRSTVPFDELIKPGSIAAFRMSRFQLPEDFRKLATNTIIMDVYFAVQRRMKELEASGKGVSSYGGGPPPVYLVIDEFQNVADLDVLQTILSEARKFGLYLIVAHQNVAQIREDLFQSFLGNAGLIMSFRVGPDDAPKMWSALGLRTNDGDPSTLTRLPNYTCVVRRNPVHGGPLTYYMRVPRAPPPRISEEEVIARIRSVPPSAAEDRRAVYRGAVEDLAARTGRSPFTPAQWAVLAALRTGQAHSYRAMVDMFYHRYFWDESVTLSAANYLMDSGLIAGRTAGGDVEYELTDAAMKHFQSEVVGPRAGGPIHNMIVRRVVRRYWEMGYYCSVDDGTPGDERPDIMVWRPMATKVDSKWGKRSMREPSRWDPEPIAIEVETLLGRRRQVMKNIDKCRKYANAVFITDSEEHASKLRELMRQAGADFKVQVEDVGQREEAPGEKDLDSFIVSLVMNGWPGIEEAARLGGVDPEDVEEHLRGLIELGVLKETNGKLEAVTESARVNAADGRGRARMRAYGLRSTGSNWKPIP
ncbi:Conserved domain protein [Conexivisphaera calida]|uniref:Conserved domain protein n=1 Tax=Conexivisphaera calida TaxID=1874277 RepID=A0A4P2VLR0_9ARCH|nr:Conserved domain protein [Conexivisphaera calida]